MDNNQWTGFIMGCALGFDLDSDEIDTILRAANLTSRDDLMACQKAIHDHIGEARWQNGIRLIQARMRPAELN